MTGSGRSTTPSATSEVGRVFAQGSYQVTGGSASSGDGFVTAALAQPVYGDAAVEVTVRSVWLRRYREWRCGRRATAT